MHMHTYICIKKKKKLNSLSVHLKKVKRKEHLKPRESKTKEIQKMKLGISKIENKQ